MACAAGYILVVEDDRDIREALAEHIEGLGCATVQAGDGMEGLQALERANAPPCLVLLDMAMPRLDGEGFLASLRARDPSGSIPIVSMSAEPARLPAASAGHLVKPFGADEVTACIACRCRTGRVSRNRERAIRAGV